MILFEVFWKNFIGFDFLIFVLAIFNVFLVLRTKRLIKNVLAVLQPQGYLPGGKQNSEKLSEHFELYLSPEGEQIMQEKYRRTNFSYTMFENITSIFPLMGLLGTGVSLLPMVAEVGSMDSTTGLFFAALTSTFWGIVFAIIFKAINGILQAEIEYLDSLATLYFERNSVFLGQKENQNLSLAIENSHKTEHENIDQDFIEEKPLKEKIIDEEPFEEDLI